MQKTVCVALVVLLGLSVEADDLSERMTSKGLVRGLEVLNKEDNSTIGFKFLGIPYAQPLLKDLRYKKPQEKSAWKDPLDATRPKPQCLAQPHISKESGNYTTITTENCLYVNVIVPEQCNQNTSCPVLVRIPNTDESPNESLADKFAFENGIVVVTVSYRIRSFGFLNLSPNVTISQNTNVALHDISMALNWINKEIHVFQGDPTQVTLYGNRNAAFLIDLLSLSPTTSHLFSRTILTSATANYRDVTQKSSCCASQVFSINAQCARSDTEFSKAKNSEIVLSCLRSRDPNYLLDVENKMNLTELFQSPMIDGGEQGIFPQNVSSLSANRSALTTLLISFSNEHLQADDLFHGGKVDEKKLKTVCADLTGDKELAVECGRVYSKSHKAINIYNDKRIYFGFIKSALSMIEANSSVYLMEIYGDHTEEASKMNLEKPKSVFSKVIASFIREEEFDENHMEKYSSDKHNYYLLEEENLKPKQNYHTEAVNFWIKVDLKHQRTTNESTQCCASPSEKRLFNTARKLFGDRSPSPSRNGLGFPLVPSNFIAAREWSPLHNAWFTVALFIVIFAVLYIVRRWIKERERHFAYDRLSDDVQLHLFNKQTVYG
uniref:COesterase domain-containing protein n=1 Tax=Steinernema glaseri TaxID=37863 RepID=A0A1I8AMA5_9BILA